MKKYTKKLLTLVAVLAMVFSLGTTAFAAGEYLYGETNILTYNDIISGNSSTSIVSSTMDSTATVKVIFEAGDCLDYNTYSIISNSAFREEFSVYVTDTTPDDGINGVTVANLLDTIAINVNTYGLVLNQVSDPTEEHIYFLESVEHAGTIWSTGGMGFDGWAYRVNDKLPVRATANDFGYESTLANQTPIFNGDVIHFFFDMPSDLDDESGNMAANFIRGTYSSRTANSVTVQLQGHKTWIDPLTYPDYIYHIYQYCNVGSGITAILCDANGIPVSGIASAVSDANGFVVFSGSIPAGNYVVKTTSSLRSFSIYDDWFDFCNNTFFMNTGAYSKITVPAA